MTKEKILRGIKYRFFPTEKQKTYINAMFGAKRFFYNKTLETYLSLEKENREIKEYNSTHEDKKEPIAYSLLLNNGKPNPNYSKNSLIQRGFDGFYGEVKDYSWLKNYSSTIYQNEIANLGNSWKTFFKSLKTKNKVGKPKMKRRNSVNSITLQNTSSLKDGKNIMDWKNSRIKTPGFNKLGWCKCELHRRFKGMVKETTISKDIDGSYYISLIVESEGSYPQPSGEVTKENTIGIDFGLKTLATISNANDDSNNYEKIVPSYFAKVCDLEKKINRLKAKRTLCQATLTREGCESKCLTIKQMDKARTNNKRAFSGYHITYSKGYEEYTKRINKLTVRINNIKKNYTGEEASSIVNRDCANAICVETLDIRGMSIRNKTREAEGKKIPNKVKRRRKMAHKLGQLAIGSIISQIEYDSIKAGKHFIKAPANYASTKICNCCGHKLEDIGLDVRKWVCPVCGQEHDRDVNAAKNLAKYAYALKNDIDLKDIYHKVEAEVMAER